MKKLMQLAQALSFLITPRGASSFLGLFTVAVASFFLTGYIFDRPGYYTWPAGKTPVALPTSLLFIALGSAMHMLAARRNADVSERMDEDEDRLQRIEQALKDLPCHERH